MIARRPWEVFIQIQLTIVTPLTTSLETVLNMWGDGVPASHLLVGPTREDRIPPPAVQGISLLESLDRVMEAEDKVDLDPPSPTSLYLR